MSFDGAASVEQRLLRAAIKHSCKTMRGVKVASAPFCQQWDTIATLPSPAWSRCCLLCNCQWMGSSDWANTIKSPDLRTAFSSLAEEQERVWGVGVVTKNEWAKRLHTRSRSVCGPILLPTSPLLCSSESTWGGFQCKDIHTCCFTRRLCPHWGGEWVTQAIKNGIDENVSQHQIKK